MADEWKDSTLGDVTDFLSGGTPSKGQAEYWNGSIPWVSAKDMKQFRLRDSEDHVTEAGSLNGTRLAPAGSVLLLVRGMTLLNDLPICVISKPMTFNQDVKALRPNQLVTDDFLPYLLLGNKGRLLSQVDLAGHGTGRLNSDELKALEIQLPPKPEQRAIAHILGTLDDKIELNRRRNQTLEAMARALFQDWFVDFGPVRAKMEGREPYLPTDLWQLFPDRLDDEGKPEGWTHQCVADIGSIICGKTPSTQVPEYYGDDIPFITIPEMHGNIFATDIKKRLSHEGAKSQAKKMLPPGSICVSCIATLGLVIITTEPSQTNQQINSVLPAQKNETYYWYWLLKNLGQEIKAGGSGGSVLSNLSTGRFAELQINASTRPLRLAYNSTVENLFAQILANKIQSRSLISLRDTLLSKLISGELRIKRCR